MNEKNIEFKAKIVKGSAYPHQDHSYITVEKLKENILTYLQRTVTVGGNMGDIENLSTSIINTEYYDGGEGVYVFIEGSAKIRSSRNLEDREELHFLTTEILQDYIMSIVDGACSITLIELK